MVFILINSPGSILVSDDMTGPPRGDKDRLSAVPNIKHFKRYGILELYNNLKSR